MEAGIRKEKSLDATALGKPSEEEVASTPPLAPPLAHHRNARGKRVERRRSRDDAEMISELDDA